jgi:hypothetical protein
MGGWVNTSLLSKNLIRWGSWQGYYIQNKKKFHIFLTRIHPSWWEPRHTQAGKRYMKGKWSIPWNPAVNKRQTMKEEVASMENWNSAPEYVILDDFLSFYPGYTWSLPGVFQWSRIFHILDKSAITWCNCILPGVFTNTWGRIIHGLEPVFISIPGVQII